MSDYIKLFKSHVQYNAYINSENAILPNVSYCENNNDVHYNPIDFSKQYLTTVASENGTISFNIWKNMGTDYITSISYSTDNGETWTTTANQDNKSENLVITVNVNQGDAILWKGNAQQTGYFDNEEEGEYVGSFFSSTARFNVDGNVMSLCYGDNFVGQTTLNYEGQFVYLFCDWNGDLSTLLVSAKNLALPATTLTEYCYYSMFSGCTALTTAPDLPATTLADNCYSYMFNGCSSLTTTPQLPATTLYSYCYHAMFYGCTSLTTAPNLPATTLAHSCYQNMFNSCTSLVTAPTLPATTLAVSCYSDMFDGCTSLVTAPSVLPATTLAGYCYGSMFSGCTALTTAPVLPATTLANNCYANMFVGCRLLNSITCLATDISASACISFWVDGVASSGTFTKAPGMSSWTIGENGIPSGWTIVNASA